MMRALIADDDRSAALVVSRALARWGFDALVAHDGLQAWAHLTTSPAPSLAIVDWEMPGLDGPELCRRIRNDPSRPHVHLLLLTGRSSVADIVAGLDAGADDYLVKPVNLLELHARINVGVRIVTLQDRLAEKVRELEVSLARVKQLRGLLPICCYCKRIRNDQNYWERVEVYVTEHTDATFTHGVCPSCMDVARADMSR